MEKLFYSANLALIVVSLFGWIIKWFYRPKAYKAHFKILYPGQFYVGLLFLLQILEIPYLLDLADVKALRYANSFSMLLTPPIMLIICRKYFFPKRKFQIGEAVMFIPAFILFIIFLLRSTGIISFGEIGKQIILHSSITVFAWFFYQTVLMAIDIGKVSKNVEMQYYSDIQDYTRNFAQHVQWIPTLLCIIMFLTFILHNPWVKFASDIISIVCTVMFVMYTLDPWLEIEFAEEQRICEDAMMATEQKSKRRMSDSRYENLRQELFKLFDEKGIHLTPHLTLDLLLKELSTNRNYLCETIARSGYKSFYDLVNSYRVKHAIKLIKDEPQSKMVDIAYRSGFASAASMNKAFTQQGLTTPSSHR